MGVTYVGDGNPDGVAVGRSGDKISFLGATAVVQPTSSSQAAVTATAVTAVATTATITTAAHGFATGTHGDAVVKRVAQLQVDVAALIVLTNQLRSELVTLGLITGS